MYKLSNFFFVPTKLICRHTTRYKDYKVIWKKAGILEDWQNLANKSPTLTEIWESEKSDVTDISRLPNFLKNRKSDIMKLTPPRERYETTIDYQRTTYAYYGNSSNIDPGEVTWPCPESIELVKDREENYETSFAELMNNVKQKNEMKKTEIEKFQARIKKNIGLLPKLMDQYKQKQIKVIDETSNREKKRLDLIREAREYYGFTISYSDPRMEKFREIKAAEAKRKSKEGKKKLLR